MRVLGFVILAGLLLAAPAIAADKKSDPWAGIVPVVPAQTPGGHVAVIVAPKAAAEKLGDTTTIEPARSYSSLCDVGHGLIG